MDENLRYDVSYCGTEDEDVQAWVVMSNDLLLELGIYDDEGKADFMYQSLGGDALQFYDRLPMHVQYSWQLMKSPFDVDAYCDDNECFLSDLHAERGLQMVDDASAKLFDGDDVSESGYCSDFESDDYSVSLFSVDESVDGTPCDGAFADGESSCDDPATFNPFWYMGEIKTKYPNQAHSANERDQILESFDKHEGACKESNTTAIECRAFDACGDACQLTNSLPLAIDVDDCEQSDDASDAYAKYYVVFVDDQLLSHDEEVSDRGSEQPASMHKDLDDEADWGFDLPVVEMDADMTSYVEKACERLRILKSQRKTDQACNHGMLNTLFLGEAESAGSDKEKSNVQQISDVFGSGVLPSEVDTSAEFGHVCTDMVSWSEADNESKQKGQSNGSMSVPALEAKVNVMLQELSDVCQHQSLIDERFIYEDFCLLLIMWDLPTFVWDPGGRL
ncbi:hypothetical protein L7F22_030254 [Adiantum nelumboides]|nr:hypothetical protein [Adiantum nelumboides]